MGHRRPSLESKVAVILQSLNRVLTKLSQSGLIVPFSQFVA